MWPFVDLCRTNKSGTAAPEARDPIPGIDEHHAAATLFSPEKSSGKWV